MFEFLADPTVWLAFGTLTIMEIVLGIDNIVFISVLVSRLPREQAEFARKLGIGLALAFRIVLLLLISWIISLNQTVLSVAGFDLSWKDIILIAGGVFLVYKATHEMHAAIEEPHELDLAEKAKATLQAIIIQIVVIDMVFSIDSIITAVGMVPTTLEYTARISIMVAAVLVAVGVMFIASGPIAKFVADHPTTKMLALAFLLLIGVTLVADGLGFHIPKGYIYSAMAFSVLVEAVNIFAKQRRLGGKARGPVAPFTGAAGSVTATAGVAAVKKPSTKSTPTARAQSRPKSAPRKPKAPK
ncbi:TerC family protein [Devosia sp. 2618]|uniref:TerC family protein n=1 Tax=Devosia sp. 2618 TaxID=3156454 RepID=UPI00339952BB